MEREAKDTVLKVAPIVRKVSADTFAKTNGLSRMTVYRMLQAGQIEGAIKYRGQWRIPITSL